MKFKDSEDGEHWICTDCDTAIIPTIENVCEHISTCVNMGGAVWKKTN